MSMYMNMNNGPVRPAARGARGVVPVTPCLGEPIAAGKAADTMGSVEEPIACQQNQNETSCSRPCPRSVAFCETLTLHESFDASCITEESARIAYDTSFLGYTVEELTMSATLPCGGTCPVPVQRVTLTGAIPYLISVGPVSSGCGSQVDLCIQGSTMVDEVVGYACGSSDPDLSAVTCSNVTPSLRVSVTPCGCSDKTNVTVCGKFTFNNLPPLT
ncbi:MAG: hypothetical protein EOM66_07415 [Clostridia bacterium]|nr:hypothetical protein [Candidatus Pelethousia sp.]NCB31223.1 hypothetical protein [Clostridia bacterium]